MKIYIRNMDCESCKFFMRYALKKLKLHPTQIELGEVTLKETLSAEQKIKLNNLLNEVHMEILEHPGAILVEKIKKTVSTYIKNSSQTTNFSNYLNKTLDYDYKYLSNVFSELEHTTITAYMTAVKMEFAKEMILFDKKSLSEIAEKLHYSNLSHFSVQFRKYTGIAPSQFRKSTEHKRFATHELGTKK